MVVVEVTSTPSPRVTDFMRHIWRTLNDMGEPSDSWRVAKAANAPRPSTRRALHALELGGFVKCYDRPKQCDAEGRVLRQLYLTYLEP